MLVSPPYWSHLAYQRGLDTVRRAGYNRISTFNVLFYWRVMSFSKVVGVIVKIDISWCNKISILTLSLIAILVRQTFLIRPFFNGSGGDEQLLINFT